MSFPGTAGPGRATGRGGDAARAGGGDRAQPGTPGPGGARLGRAALALSAVPGAPRAALPTARRNFWKRSGGSGAPSALDRTWRSLLKEGAGVGRSDRDGAAGSAQPLTAAPSQANPAGASARVRERLRPAGRRRRPGTSSQSSLCCPDGDGWGRRPRGVCSLADRLRGRAAGARAGGPAGAARGAVLVPVGQRRALQPAGGRRAALKASPARPGPVPREPGRGRGSPRALDTCGAKSVWGH